jgi:hypothetical protein
MKLSPGSAAPIGLQVIASFIGVLPYLPFHAIGS